MKKLALVVIVLLVFAGIAASTINSRVNEAYRGYSGDARELEIPAGSSTKAIGQRLVEAGIVRDTVTYRAALWLTGDARRLKAGEYLFDLSLIHI